ncbi:hypothetical protein [Streptomyces chrestomyceticus]|uniref:hypothetical protein n=1 Tax=Streptomyces chrestomyceticus TaxID=68185 RepID=UPI00379B517F
MTRKRPAQVRGGLAARRPAAFTVVDGLDAAAQRDVRALVEPLDRTFLARTLPDPHAPNDRPGWERRC